MNTVLNTTLTDYDLENPDTNLEFFTLYTKLNLRPSENFRSKSRKDLESVIQMLGLRGQPVMIGMPINAKDNKLDFFGSKKFKCSGWVLKFAYDLTGLYSEEMLSEIFNKTVLAGGIIRTKGKGVNTEILKVQNVNKR
jgi:hypothetical protein|tara:strand:- start:927 stop:1340 length:414 start_codon:yes stop_codon:yes gene_type:complete